MFDLHFSIFSNHELSTTVILVAALISKLYGTYIVGKFSEKGNSAPIYARGLRGAAKVFVSKQARGIQF